jgi:putative iron-regulated protein
VKGVAPADAKAAAETYADLVDASYGASIGSATTLRTAIQALLASPNDATLAAAKQAWLAARDDYVPTEAFRFYDGPIDNPDDGPEGQINAWPMDEAYVDYVTSSPKAGIVNNTAKYPTITTDVLVETNEKGGEKNISTGWHAIEFLLWGEDTTAGSPGQRPVSDYTLGPNATRRAEYLRLTTDLLVDDLTGVAEQWAPDGAYRKQVPRKPAQGPVGVRAAIRGAAGM